MQLLFSESSIDFINSLSNCKSACFFIRHSERENADSDVVPRATPLTSEGFSMAENLGSVLPENFKYKILTSPVLRCIQTGDSIYRTLSGRADVSKPLICNLLGNPGAYVKNREEASVHFKKIGTIPLINYYVSSNTFSGFHDCSDGTDTLLDLFSKTLSHEKTIHIFVSHDASIAAFLGSLTGSEFSNENWIPFLGGIALIEELDLPNYLDDLDNLESFDDFYDSDDFFEVSYSEKKYLLKVIR